MSRVYRRSTRSTAEHKGPKVGCRFLAGGVPVKGPADGKNLVLQSCFRYLEPHGELVGGLIGVGGRFPERPRRMHGPKCPKSGAETWGFHAYLRK